MCLIRGTLFTHVWEVFSWPICRNLQRFSHVFCRKTRTHSTRCHAYTSVTSASVTKWWNRCQYSRIRRKYGYVWHMWRWPSRSRSCFVMRWEGKKSENHLLFWRMFQSWVENTTTEAPKFSKLHLDDRWPEDNSHVWFQGESNDCELHETNKSKGKVRTRDSLPVDYDVGLCIGKCSSHCSTLTNVWASIYMYYI